MGQTRKGYQHLPTNVLPVLARLPELGWLWTLPAVRLCDSDCDDTGINKREDDIAGCDLPHAFVKGIPAAVRVALGRPQISAPQFVAVCLILVYPPIAHVISTSLAETDRWNQESLIGEG